MLDVDLVRLSVVWSTTRIWWTISFFLLKVSKRKEKVCRITRSSTKSSWKSRRLWLWYHSNTLGWRPIQEHHKETKACIKKNQLLGPLFCSRLMAFTSRVVRWWWWEYWRVILPMCLSFSYWMSFYIFEFSCFQYFNLSLNKVVSSRRQIMLICVKYVLAYL